MSCTSSLCHACVFDPVSRRIIPVLYLPKTWPSHPVPRREAIFGSILSSTHYKTVSLQPVWPHEGPAKAMATVPTVEVSFTDNFIYIYSCAHRTVVVLPIQRHIPIRSIHPPKAYYPQQGGSRSGTTPRTRVGSPFGKVHHSADPWWSCWGERSSNKQRERHPNRHHRRRVCHLVF